MTALEMDRNKYNVVGLNADSVYAKTRLFLDNKKKKSESTAKSYELTINQFMVYCFGSILIINIELTTNYAIASLVVLIQFCFAVAHKIV
jgi:hypothetical protein